MRPRSPQSRGGAHVPAGPVRPSPIERPWRTMFAATVSAFCTPCANPRAPCSAAHCAPQKCGPVRRETRADHRQAPAIRHRRVHPEPGGVAGISGLPPQQRRNPDETSVPSGPCPSALPGPGLSGGPVRLCAGRRPPGATNRDPVAAHIVRHKTANRAARTRRPAAALCAPQNRGGCVPAGPVRFSCREPPWRTMFAATVSAGCKHLAARLPRHSPFGTPVAAHSVRHKMRTRSPQSRSGGTRTGRPRPPGRGGKWAAVLLSLIRPKKNPSTVK